jgi:hypothetical protein
MCPERTYTTIKPPLPPMDAKLHRIPNVVGDDQKALLLVHTTGMDVPHRGIHNIPDP